MNDGSNYKIQSPTIHPSNSTIARIETIETFVEMLEVKLTRGIMTRRQFHGITKLPIQRAINVTQLWITLT